MGFLKSDGNQTYGANRPQGPPPASIPTSAPPQPPTSVPRNVKDALNILNNSKTNGETPAAPERKPSVEKISTTTPAVAPAPPEVKAAKKVKQLDGYVGFANLPNQVYRKAVKKGFEFTLMVVGESGLGKSTLINYMFLTDIYEQNSSNSTTKLPQTLDIQEQKVKLVENDVHLTLT